MTLLLRIGSRVGELMPVPYEPIAVANEFIVGYSRDSELEHMKLQKLVYCTYGWWLTENDEPLLTEAPQVWRHGPVFPSLYRILKPFGRRDIAHPQSSNPFESPPRIDDDDVAVSTVIDWVWQRYGHLSGFALSDMTHKPGTPWHRVVVENDRRVPHDTDIPLNYIRAEFGQILDRELGRV